MESEIPCNGEDRQTASVSSRRYSPDAMSWIFCEGTRQGRTVLVLLRDTADPETGQRFTVKRYESEKTVTEDGTWRHVRIILKPANKDFKPILMTSEDEGSVEVVAEMLEVLG